MRKNERYIFLQDTRADRRRGRGVAAHRAAQLAVDTTLTPFGTPVWIDTTRR